MGHIKGAGGPQLSHGPYFGLASMTGSVFRSVEACHFLVGMRFRAKNGSLNDRLWLFTEKLNEGFFFIVYLCHNSPRQIGSILTFRLIVTTHVVSESGLSLI